MKLRVFILGIVLLTLISLASLILILINIDPYNSTPLNFILFYLSFFIAVSGLFILSGFYLRKLIIKNKIIFRLLKTSFRQGILISLISTSFLLLQSFRTLTWWTGGIIIFLVMVFEIYFKKK